jgi:hypothetical protein
LPNLSTCIFSPATVTPNGAPTTTMMTITTAGPGVASLHHPAEPNGRLHQRLYAGLWSGGFFGIAGICLLAPLRRSRKVRVFTTLMMVLIVAMIVGCGSQSNLLTPAGTSNVTVLAKSATGTQHTITIQLNVQ